MFHCFFFGSHKDTEAMRQKLQSMRERKAILMGEVRYITYISLCSDNIYHYVLNVFVYVFLSDFCGGDTDI